MAHFRHTHDKLAWSPNNWWVSILKPSHSMWDQKLHESRLILFWPSFTALPQLPQGYLGGLGSGLISTLCERVTSILIRLKWSNEPCAGSTATIPHASVSSMLDSLGWRSLEDRRADAPLNLFYKIVYNLVAVPLPQYINHQVLEYGVP